MKKCTSGDDQLRHQHPRLCDSSVPDAKALRARDLIARAMRTGWAILLLQTLAEFANVAIRKAGIPIEDIRRTIDAWRAVLPIQAADDRDLAGA